jgi:hypothetical protein
MAHLIRYKNFQELKTFSDTHKLSAEESKKAHDEVAQFFNNLGKLKKKKNQRKVSGNAK